MIDLLFMPYSFNPALDFLKREKEIKGCRGIQGTRNGIRQALKQGENEP